MSNKKVKKQVAKKVNAEHVNFLWGLICSLSSIDQQRNNISLFNVISQLNVPKEAFQKSEKFLFPLPHELVIVFRRALESKLCTNKVIIDVKVSLIDPKGSVLSELLIPIVFEIGKRTMRFRFQLPGFQLTNSGDYVYRIEVRQPDAKNFIAMNEVPFEVSPV